MTDDAKPKPGDRVKLIGTHKYAGWTGFYLDDAKYLGELRPRVKLWKIGTITFVPEPDSQMRKI